MINANPNNLETLQGVIVKTYSSSSGFTAGEILSNNQKIKFSAKMGLAENDIVILYGRTITHKKYGEQFEATSFEYDMKPSSEGLYLYLANNPAFFGIGKVRAKKIANAFADNFEDILFNNPSKIQQLGGIPESSILILQDEWKKNKTHNLASTELASYGLSYVKAKKLLDDEGIGIIGKIKKNPYILIDLVVGYGFKSVDMIALKIGFAFDSQERLSAGIEYVVSENEDKGNCWLAFDTVIINLNKELGLKSEHRELIENTISLLVSADKLALDTITDQYSQTTTLASRKLYDKEQYLINVFNTQVRSLDATHLIAFLKEYESNIPIDYRLNSKQFLACTNSLSYNISGFVGAAGTGKTHSIKSIINTAVSNHVGRLSIALAAPTGKAAKRMEELTFREAKTIHRLLEYSPASKSFTRNAENQLEVDIIVIDEVSMVDIPLFYCLIQAINFNRTRLILVGDDNQLPPVGVGNILRDLINSKAIPLIVLDEVMRNAGALKHNSLAILKGSLNSTTEEETEKRPGLKRWYLLNNKVQDQQVIFALHQSFETSLEKYGFDLLFDIQVLTPTHKGALGTKALNIYMQKLLQKKLYNIVVEPVIEGHKPMFYPGDKIIQTRNNYNFDIMNGSQGIIKSIVKKKELPWGTDKKIKELEEWNNFSLITLKDDDYILLIDFGTKLKPRLIALPKTIEILNDIELAYVITCHKCVTGDTLITLHDGLYKIADLAKGISQGQIRKDEHLVYGFEKTNKTNEVFFGGVKPTIKFTTRIGYSIETSHQHPLMVYTPEGKFIWKKAPELQKGDHLVFRKGLGVGKTEYINFSDFQSKLPNTTGINRRIGKIPQFLDENLGWLLGVLIGDGNYTDKKDGRVEISSIDPEWLKKIEQGLNNNFAINITKRNKKQKTENQSIYFHSRTVREFLQWLGLDYVTAKYKTIPSLIFQSPLTVQKAFIQGLYDTDGGIKKEQIHFTTTSKTLAFELHQLLLNNGIITSRYLLREEIKEKNHSEVYRVDIMGQEARSFVINIGFTRQYKKDNSIKFFGKLNQEIPKSNWLKLPNGKSFAETLRNELYNRGGRNYPEAKKISNLLSRIINSGNALSVYHIHYLAKHIQNLLELKESYPVFDKILNKGFFFDSIVEIEQSENYVYDLHVPEDHTYIGNGLVNHNSQGSEFPCVIVICHSMHSFMLHRNWFYTAVTRARESCIILGDNKGTFIATAKEEKDRRLTYSQFYLSPFADRIISQPSIIENTKCSSCNHELGNTAVVDNGVKINLCEVCYREYLEEHNLNNPIYTDTTISSPIVTPTTSTTVIPTDVTTVSHPELTQKEGFFQSAIAGILENQSTTNSILAGNDNNLVENQSNESVESQNLSSQPKSKGLTQTKTYNLFDDELSGSYPFWYTETIEIQGIENIENNEVTQT